MEFFKVFWIIRKLFTMDTYYINQELLRVLETEH